MRKNSCCGGGYADRGYERTAGGAYACVLPAESAGMLLPYKDYIAGEVLADSLSFEGDTDTECELNGVPVKLAVALAK